jgi:PadR family transcriptional regulator, regulatory protein PadR
MTCSRRVIPEYADAYVRVLPMTDVRMTVAVARVLREFLANPSEPHYGYELMQLTGFPSGKLYPLLVRLQRAGWLIREPESPVPVQVGRPSRWLYRLSPSGAEHARHELSVLSQQLEPVALPPLRLAQGGAG